MHSRYGVQSIPAIVLVVPATWAAAGGWPWTLTIPLFPLKSPSYRAA